MDNSFALGHEKRTHISLTCRHCPRSLSTHLSPRILANLGKMSDADQKPTGGRLSPILNPANSTSTDLLPPPYDGDGDYSGAPAAESIALAVAPESSASTGGIVAPPTYQDVSAAGPRHNLASSDPPTLILDGYTIHAEAQPARPLYELGLAPMSGRNGICGIEKIWYSVGAAAADGSPRQHRRFIYELRIFLSIDHMFGHVEIIGKAGPSRSHRKMQLAGGAGWATCKAEGHFKAQTSLGQRLFNRGGGVGEKKLVHVEWKDMDGKVVALEEFPSKPKDGSEPVDLARLNVQVTLEDKELDALVACWLARIWRVRRSQTKEPLSWAMGEPDNSTSCHVGECLLTAN